MISNEVKKDRQLFTSAVKKVLSSMGLKILEHGIDYGTDKPDIVAIYPDKAKYYIIECLSIGCVTPPSPRLYIKDAYQEYRHYCSKLFTDDINAAVAAAIVCDLAAGIEAFNYKSIDTYTLNAMTRYGSLILPTELVSSAGEVFDKLGVDFRTLDILDDFTLILISKEDTLRLSEVKKFISFILANR